MKNNLEMLVRAKYNIPPDGKLPSQAAIADAVGVSQNTVSRWLAQRADRFDNEIVIAFCKFFKCSLAELLYIDERETA